MGGWGLLREVEGAKKEFEVERWVVGRWAERRSVGGGFSLRGRGEREGRGVGYRCRWI